MGRFFALLLFIVWFGCAGQAYVEIGMNDAALFAGVFGDLQMNVSRIEIAETGDYSTIWQGRKQITVAIQSSDYVPLTDAPVTVVPGSYRYLRITIDSLRYVDGSPVLLREASLLFVAQAFANIAIEENDELRLVVLANSNNWFDLDSLRITPGKDAFEGAALRIYYE